VDKRIPTEITGKTSGEAELRAGSGNDEKSGSFSLDGSAQQWAWHLEGNKRRTGDYAIPGLRVRTMPAHKMAVSHPALPVPRT
jgi:iron complex outermembrane receptor protein